MGDVRPRRVLIADDSPAIVAQLSTICRDILGEPEILVAHDLTLARTFLSRLPDIIFLDLRLARDESGLDLLWDIGRSLASARVVTMTGLPEEDPLVIAARTIGVHAHIEKPLRRDAVRAALGPLGTEKAK